MQKSFTVPKCDWVHCIVMMKEHFSEICFENLINIYMYSDREIKIAAFLTQTFIIHFGKQ